MNGRLWFWAETERGEAPWVGKAVSFLAGLVLLLAVLGWAFAQSQHHWNWGVIETYRVKLIQGWLHTVVLSAAALVLSLFLGVGLALARSSPFLPLRYFARTYIELVRCTPLLVQLLITYYFITNAMHLQNRYVVGAVTLALFSAAYISEIIRGGVESVGASQRETAQALGLSQGQLYRFVIVPQALRQILPALAGQLLLLIKDSSLLSVLGIKEFTQNAQEVNAYTFSTMEGYLVLAAGYLILTLPLSLCIRQWEQRFRYET